MPIICRKSAIKIAGSSNTAVRHDSLRVRTECPESRSPFKTSRIPAAD